MAKIKSAFFCSNCGYESSKWLGKCPTCLEWNTFTEEIINKNNTSNEDLNYLLNQNYESKTALTLKNIKSSKDVRILSIDNELNRVLGGGIVSGSLVLVGGEPGIGKSTLFLQLALSLSPRKILYVSGEESETQIKMRAERIAFYNEQLYILTETNTQKIFKQISLIEPELIIIDSIQTMHSILIESPQGSVSQIRQTAAEFQRLAKETHVPIFLIGHITKDGSIAGPKILEHIVDTVLQFEGDRHYSYRILRTLKNRFGNAAELGIYEMLHNGLKQVDNPSELLITQKPEALSGSTIAATMEGMRPLLVETQALVSQTIYSTPQRTVTGIDLRRLQILLAVLEKRGGFLFGNKDVFINIAGGIRLEDPSLDLALVCALLSSFQDIALSPKICFAGEVGLNGEIRGVTKIETRIKEADKLGFEKIIISGYNAPNAKNLKTNIEIVSLYKVEELYKKFFV